MLGRLGLRFATRPNVGNQGEVNSNGISDSLFQFELANRFEKGKPFDIPHRTSHLNDDHTHTPLLPTNEPDSSLDLVRNMWNHLHRIPEVLSLPLFFNHGAVDLTRRRIVPLTHIDVQEPLVVPQVEVRLRTILGDKDLSVLIRTQGPRIDVQIGIDFQNRHPQSA